MKIQFLNDPEDCQWLREGALKGIADETPFQSFVLYGNEDSPGMVDLYESNDPLYSDPFVRVNFETGSVYRIEGK